MSLNRMLGTLGTLRTVLLGAVLVATGADVTPARAFDGELLDTVRVILPDSVITRRDQALAERSAVRWPEKLNPATPILLLHGSADWRVDPGQVLAMTSKLYALRRPFRLVFFEGGDHGLTHYRDEVDRLAREWLDRYVRDGKAWPSLEPHGS